MYFVIESYPYEGYDFPEFFFTLEEALKAPRATRVWREIYKVDLEDEDNVKLVASCVGKGKWDYAAS